MARIRGVSPFLPAALPLSDAHASLIRPQANPVDV
jgi:hypothetical protein